MSPLDETVASVSDRHGSLDVDGNKASVLDVHAVHDLSEDIRER